jgi:tetratricopeptide (TPR) repeat protein
MLTRGNILYSCFGMPLKYFCFKKIKFAVPITLLFLSSLFCLAGCQALPDRGPLKKNGKVYGVTDGLFQHRWWHYYERALSYMEGEFYEEALLDLDIAVNKRFADKRRARTYGLHFVDYFPHREKGLTYYLIGDYESAKKELALSIQDEPSAKALFYRDKIRKILLETKKPLISSPNIRVNLPSDEIWTKADPVIISGTAEDTQYISKIAFSGQNYYLKASRQNVNFSESFSLDQGEHVIEVYAQNLLGGDAVRNIVIHVDRQGPVIIMQSQASQPAVQKKIKGYLYDESGEISLYADGRKVAIQKGKDIPFSIPVFPGSKTIHLLAKDKLGNETQAVIDLTDMAAKRGNVLVAANEYSTVASDSGIFKLALFSKSKDKYPPTIKLNGWTDEQTVFMDKVFIEGDVRDQNNIVDLTVNNIPILRRKGSNIFFNHLMDLKEGKNLVTIKAEDESGNTAVKEIIIIRDVPTVLQLDSRFSMTLIPFDNKGMDTGLNHSYDNQFLLKLMDQNRFRIIERARLDLILQEQKLSNTKLIDENTALRLGRLVAAQSTMVGNFIETRIGIEVVARLIDNETSEIIAVKDVYDEFKDRAALRDLAEGMAIKFHRDFPLLDGMIIEIKGNSFYIDIGKGKIKPNTRLIVYKESAPIHHPDTGKILGKDTQIIGHARVTHVMEQMAKVDLLKGETIKGINIKDKVITQ